MNMRHPFVKDLSGKSLEEIQSIISDLQSKLNFAHRTQNSSLIMQLNMIIASYRAEYDKKMDELIKKQNIQTTINIQKDN